MLRHQCTAFSVQRARVLSSILLRIHAIQECIGIEGVADAGGRGHFGSVDKNPILERIMVNRVKVASGTGGQVRVVVSRLWCHWLQCHQQWF